MYWCVILLGFVLCRTSCHVVAGREKHCKTPPFHLRREYYAIKSYAIDFGCCWYLYKMWAEQLFSGGTFSLSHKVKRIDFAWHFEVALFLSTESASIVFFSLSLSNRLILCCQDNHFWIWVPQQSQQLCSPVVLAFQVDTTSNLEHSVAFGLVTYLFKKV